MKKIIKFTNVRNDIFRCIRVTNSHFVRKVTLDNVRGLSWKIKALVFLLIPLMLLIGVNAVGAAGEDRYWVGGTGNWNDTNHWSASDGGLGGASVPDGTDDVFFNGNSGGGTVTVNVSATTRDLDFTGYTGTFAGSSALNISGSLTLGSEMTRTYTGAITFSATTTGHTLTLNGKTTSSNTDFNGVGGGWTIQDSWNNGSGTITISAGTLDSNSQTITISNTFATGNGVTRTLTLGSSTINVANWSAGNTDNLTFNSDTSHIVQSGTGSFSGGDLTYYNVSIAHSATTSTIVGGITGANTFNNLTFTGNGTTTGTGGRELHANQIVNGTFTMNGSSANTRMRLYSNTPGTQRTITAAAVSISNVDFQDIVGAGAGTWSGTSVADGGNNSGITFTSPVTRYWIGGTGTWRDTSHWSSGTGGSGGASMPLIHDTAIFDANSFTAGSQTVTIDQNVGNLDMSAVDENPTMQMTIQARALFGDIILSPSMSVTTVINPEYRGVGSYDIDAEGHNLSTFSLSILHTQSNISLQSNFGLGGILTLTRGTFNANGHNVTIGRFSSSNSNTRTITMGSGTWTLTGNAASIWDTGTITNLTLNKGSNPVILNYSGSTGTRNILSGSVPEGSAPDFSITAGSDILTIFTNTGSLDFTGFSGTLTNSSRTIFGNLTLSTGMTVSAGTGVTTMGATSGTKTITSNGKTLDFPLTINGVGGTFLLADDLTLGSTRTLTVTNGTFNANGQDVTTGILSSSNSNSRTITMGSGTWYITGNNTLVWNFSTVTNLILNKGNPVIVNYSGSTGTRNFQTGSSISEASAPDFNITAGSDIIDSSSGSRFGSLDFTGFSGTWTNIPRTIFGNLTLSSGMTLSAGSSTITMAATSGTKTITSNGKTMDFPLTIDGAGGTFQLGDALTLGSTRTFTVTRGTFNANNQNLTFGLFNSSNSNTRTINMGSGTWEINGDGTSLWTTNVNTNLTFNANTSTIKLTGTLTADRNFQTGQLTFNNYWNATSGAFAVIITDGTSTYNNFKINPGREQRFFNATTIIVSSFDAVGTSGNEITLSSSSTTNFNLVKTGGGVVAADYLIISDSDASPSNTWYAGANSLDNGGANSGWIFSGVPKPKVFRGHINVRGGVTFR